MTKRILINELKVFAKLRGGYLLSENYIDNKQKLLWKCNCGHEWYASWVNVKYCNSWCPVCSSIIRDVKRRKYTINDLYKIIAKKSGVLLSKKYVNCDNKLEIKCQNNHIFYLTTRQIETNNWCPECDRKNVSNQFKNVLKNKNGMLVKGEIISNKSEVIIKCKNNHTWKTKIYNIIYNKTWCPFCFEYKGEEKIKNYLNYKSIQYYRQHTFDDLKGQTKRRTKLRFDFYLPKQNALIEFDGRQHYVPVNFRGCSNKQAQKTHLKLIRNDKIKNKYCVDNNIRLIRIPHTIKNVEEHLDNILK